MQNCSDIMNENGNISDCSDVNQIQDLEVGIDFVKIAVLSIIIVLTFLGNVAIIIAIAAKGSRSKLTRHSLAFFRKLPTYINIKYLRSNITYSTKVITE